MTGPEFHPEHEIHLKDPAARDTVAVILAAGLVVAINLFIVGAWLRIFFASDVELSDNATLVIQGALTGLLGIVGPYVGYQIGKRNASKDPGTLHEHRITRTD